MLLLYVYLASTYKLFYLYYCRHLRQVSHWFGRIMLAVHIMQICEYWLFMSVQFSLAYICVWLVHECMHWTLVSFCVLPFPSSIFLVVWYILVFCIHFAFLLRTLVYISMLLIVCELFCITAHICSYLCAYVHVCSLYTDFYILLRSSANIFCYLCMLCTVSYG